MQALEPKQTVSGAANKRSVVTAALLGGFALSMLGAAYAAVPLYRMFCQVTGFGGTTQRAEAPSAIVLERRVMIRFDSNVAGGLQWVFKPSIRTMEVKLGESALTHYKVQSSTSQATSGSATFNVTPEAAGRYFNKIECFCFSEQSLEPSAGADLPLTFFVDPAMADDPELAHVDEITLSYTFFPIDGDTDAVGQARGSAPAGT